MSTISVVGQEIKPASDEHASLQKRFAFKVETRTAVQLGATRGKEAPLQLEAADDDVIEFEYSNGLRQWTTVGELRARNADPAASRGKDDPITITACRPQVRRVARLTWSSRGSRFSASTLKASSRTRASRRPSTTSKANWPPVPAFTVSTGRAHWAIP